MRMRHYKLILLLFTYYFSMASLEKHTFDHQKPNRITFQIKRAKSLSRKQRHYRSTKMMKTLLFNETTSHNLAERNGSSQTAEAAYQKKELKKFCISKFKAVKDQQKPLVKRKTPSVNLFRREQVQKLKQTLTTQEIKSSEALPSVKDAGTNNNLEKQFQSQRSYTPKRRFQVLKISCKNFKVKTETTEENQEKREHRTDVSFEQTLKKQTVCQQKEKLAPNEEIKTEEFLGKGLRKGSLSKKKILVKNPFERHKKQKQALLQQVKQFETNELIEFNESKIAHNLDSSFPSLAHHEQLSELLAMI